MAQTNRNSPAFRITENVRMYRATGVTNGVPVPRHVTLESPDGNGRFGAAACGIGDWNGDGRPDFAVGEPRYRSADGNVGRVWLLMTPTNRWAEAHVLSFDGPHKGSLFGLSLAGTSIRERGGVPALLVAAPRLSREGAQVGGIFRITSGTNIPTAQMPLVAVGARAEGEFARSIAWGGDVNGDGVFDLLAGAPADGEAAGGAGSAFIFQGPVSNRRMTATWSIQGEQTNSAFGRETILAGDLNGDGIGDVVIGTPRFQTPVQGVGRVSVYFGFTNGLPKVPDWTHEGTVAREGLGGSIACGDLNGDGRMDLIAGAPGNGEGSGVAGSIRVFFGPLGPSVQTPHLEFSGAHPGSEFGHALAVVRDMTGDGRPELMVSAPAEDRDAPAQGRVYLLALVGGGRPELRVLATVDGAHTRSRYGWVLAEAGDIDGDGLADVLIGSPYHHGSSGELGRVDLLFGSREAFVGDTRYVTTYPAQKLTRSDPASVADGATPGPATNDAASDSRSSFGMMLGAAGLFGLAGVFVARRWWQRLEKQAVNSERARIARELHDNVAPELTRIALIESKRDRGGTGDTPGSESAAAARHALEAMGEFVWATNPKNDSLDECLTYVSEYAGRVADAAGIDLELDIPSIPPGQRLSADARRALLSIVKEALNNTLKHARATRIDFQAGLDERSLRLVLCDNGCGFAADHVRAGANGIANMRERVASLDGHIAIETSPGQGTRLEIAIPL